MMVDFAIRVSRWSGAGLRSHHQARGSSHSAATHIAVHARLYHLGFKACGGKYLEAPIQFPFGFAMAFWLEALKYYPKRHCTHWSLRGDCGRLRNRGDSKSPSVLVAAAGATAQVKSM